MPKLTPKFQTTVPKEVREALHLTSRDQIIYEILEDNTVIVRKAYPLDKAFNEWNSYGDEKAYKDL